MESLELRIFREVAFEKSLTKAAEKMGYVQSNISNHIHNLEAELGTALFIRHSKGVTLTDSGNKLLAYADQVVSLLDNAKDQLQKNQPSIRIGATQTVAAYRLPIWLSEYKHRFPDVHFSVLTQLQPELIKNVVAGKLDCTFVYTEFSHPQLTPVFSFPEKLALIASKKLNLEDVAYQPIVASNVPGCPLSDILQNWVLKRTSQKSNIIQFDTVESIIQSVSLGIGISLLPVSALPHTETHNLQVIQSDDIGEVNIQLLVPKSSENFYLTQFVEMIRSHLNSIVR